MLFLLTPSTHPTLIGNNGRNSVRVLLSRMENTERWIARNSRCLSGVRFASRRENNNGVSTGPSRLHSPPSSSSSRWERFSSLLFGVRRSSASSSSSGEADVETLGAFSASCPSCFAMLGGDTHPHLWRRRSIDFHRSILAARALGNSISPLVSSLVTDSTKEEDEGRWKLVCGFHSPRP